MPDPKLPIHTERLVLRAETAADAEAIQAYRNLPHVHRYLPHGDITVETIRDRIVNAWAGPLEKDGDVLGLAVEERETGQVVGDVVLFWRTTEHRGGELGYALDPAFTGRGYATEAGRAILALGFETYDMHRIVARLDARNSASAGVLERLGMRREAHFVSNAYLKGEWTDEVIYAMVEDEWRAGQASA